MNIHIKQNKTDETHILQRTETLQELEPVVKILMDQHLEKRQLWFSSDFLPANEQNNEDNEHTLSQLRDRARSIPDAARVGVGLGMLTEEGLPHFHRIISSYLGEDNIWSKWNYMWTAEEDRHGCILRDYVRDARLFDFRALEQLQYNYMETGFNPGWDRDPYKVFVYTSLQERATQFSHRNTAKVAGAEEPLLKNILKNIAMDEGKHFTFYRNVFKSILDLDPNQALLSASELMPGIDMPGVDMPGFKDMAEVAYRVGIYGPNDYKRIVEEAIKFWQIDAITGLNDIGRKAQEAIMKVPERLEKLSQYIQRRRKTKTFGFDFLYNRTFSMV
jgi:acyl-[acyl-carrier protein] desaturase